MLLKKTVLISAVLTAFVLSMLGGVAMAIKQSAAAPVAVSSTATPVSLSAQDAAAVAATVLNQQDIYSVESASINGVNAYKVVFSSGQVAFVGLDGQILSMTQIQPVVVTQNNTDPVLTPSGFAPAQSVSQSAGEHEGDEHDD